MGTTNPGPATLELVKLGCQATLAGRVGVEPKGWSLCFACRRPGFESCHHLKQPLTPELAQVWFKQTENQAYWLKCTYALKEVRPGFKTIILSIATTP